MLKSDFIKKNNPILKFLAVFFGSYVIMAALYKLYLYLSASGSYFPDYFTQLVTFQTENILQSIGYETYTMAYEKNQSIRLAVNDPFNFVVQVIEGCNGISVIILFTSFVLAFFSGWKKTLFYIFGGATLIYTLNVIRIALITIGKYHFPQYTVFLHEILFPLFIYGVVFILWFFWVRQYKKPTKPNDE